MKNSILTILLVATSLITSGQRIIEERLPAQNGDKVYLDFKYANEVNIKTWDKAEVSLIAEVTIDDGDKNDVYELHAEKKGKRIEFYSDTDALEKRWRTIYSSNECCKGYGVNVQVNIEVKMPPALDLEYNSISGSINVHQVKGSLYLETISGNITLTPAENRLYAKTISGDVELLVEKPVNVDLSVSTISGEIFSNLDIHYEDGKSGLRQVVGQKVRGRLNSGGEEWEMKTISGNVFLRKI